MRWVRIRTAWPGRTTTEPTVELSSGEWRGSAGESKIDYRLMGLLKPRRRKRRHVRSYTTRRCLFAGHQVTWCRGLCHPVDGQGLCGRPAPHDLRGRTQLAIARFKESQDRDEE